MKTRRKTLYWNFIALIVVKFSLFSSLLTAQSVQGIYLSADDFTSNKLSFEKGSSKKYKIKLHSLSFKSPIKITWGDSIIHLNKDSVFGYKDHDGTSYRFFNKTVFTMMNPGANILLYKVMSAAKTKYEEATYSYYYSKDVNSPVMSLTLRNLENTFSDNKVFVDFLEVHFRNNDELLEYDSNHRMYKINHLLELSKNQK